MSADIIDFDHIAGRLTPAAHNRRVQRPRNPFSNILDALERHPNALAKAREPDSLAPSERERVLQFVRTFQDQPRALADWIMVNATAAALATLTGTRTAR